MAAPTRQPLQAKPCRCDEPVGDPRELTCIRCGRQIGGVPLRGPHPIGFAGLRDHSRSAHKRPRYGGAQ